MKLYTLYGYTDVILLNKFGLALIFLASAVGGCSPRTSHVIRPDAPAVEAVEIPVYYQLADVPFDFVVVATVRTKSTELGEEDAQALARRHGTTAVVYGGPRNVGFAEGKLAKEVADRMVVILVKPRQ